MRNAIEVITKLAERVVIEDYAITGAVAALAYVEPMLTQDLDILVSIADLDERPSGLVLLGPIERALAELGYAERSDVGILVEGWPVSIHTRCFGFGCGVLEGSTGNGDCREPAIARSRR